MKKQILLLVASLIIILISGIVYYLTLSPTVSWIDSGELAVSCATLGISHPTGYPLYTLIGRIFSFVFYFNVIKGLNLFSLLCVVFFNLFLFFIFLNLASILFPFENENSLLFLALAPILYFAFTPTLWEQATKNEVYALSFLLSAVVLFLAFLWHKSKFLLKEKDKAEKIFYLLVFLYALSFGNHMSAILLFLGLLFFFFAFEGKSMFKAKRLLLAFLFFLLGLTIYLYLPLRSFQNPLMDWGHPTSWGNFKRQVTGWQYQVWMFSESTEVLKENFSSYLKLFQQQFNLILILFGFIGAVFSLLKNYKIFLFLFLIFICDIFYGINFTIQEIEPYFLLSFLAFAIFIGIGFFWVFQILSLGLVKLNPKLKIALTTLLILLFLFFPILNLLKNYYTQDRSQNYFPYDYAKNILRSLKKDAIVLTSVWDHYSPWLYLRFVENLRPDVPFIDKELCRRSWYFDFLKKNYPHLYSLSEKEILEFKQAVYPFENNLPFEPSFIEGKYQKMLFSFYEKNYPYKNLYDDLIGQSPIAPQFVRLPEGLVFRLQPKIEYYEFTLPAFELRGALDKKIYKDERTKAWLSYYSIMLKKRADYLSYFGKKEEASLLFQKYENLIQAY